MSEGCCDGKWLTARGREEGTKASVTAIPSILPGRFGSLCPLCWLLAGRLGPCCYWLLAKAWLSQNHAPVAVWRRLRVLVLPWEVLTNPSQASSVWHLVWVNTVPLALPVG